MESGQGVFLESHTSVKAGSVSWVEGVDEDEGSLPVCFSLFC